MKASWPPLKCRRWAVKKSPPKVMVRGGGILRIKSLNAVGCPGEGETQFISGRIKTGKRKSLFPDEVET